MYAKIVLALPIEKAFFYESDFDLRIGSYVRVKFGSLFTIGLVVEIHRFCSLQNLKKVKEAINIPKAEQQFIEFMSWTSKYNMIPMGSILKIVLSGINKGRKYYSFSLSNKQKLTLAYKKVVDVLKGCEILHESAICEKAKVRSSTLVQMFQENILEERSYSTTKSKPVVCNINLSDQQKVAFQLICQHSKYKAIFLEGVTGSGKTEVYLKVIFNILNKSSNSQALVLLPEIILASQLEQRFNKYFTSVNIVTWHSSLSKKRRTNNWWEIVNGEAQIIIGTRSALFLPYKNLKIIVVDEEHDNSFKQGIGRINYHARDMAIIRAQKENILIILSSATPSLETFCNVKSGKFEHVVLSERHTKIELPDTHIVDMRKNRNGKFISAELYAEILGSIEKKQQVLLFLNRRGYSSFMQCDNCSYKPQCINCSTFLTRHKFHQILLCHSCGYKVKLQNLCSKCGTVNSLRDFGFGVEKIEEEVRSEIPKANVIVMSSDLINSVDKSRRLLQEIFANRINIIIGTQVITKGHHFPNLNLVGIINSDYALYNGDLRYSEQTYQMLQQVSGRAGRENVRGKVLLQTYNPDKISTKYLCNAEKFYSEELKIRQENNMPPFTRISSIVISHVNKNKAAAISNEIKSFMLYEDKIKILGPIPADVYLVRKKYIYVIAIISPKKFNIQQYLQNCASLKKYKKVISIDIDSYNLP